MTLSGNIDNGHGRDGSGFYVPDYHFGVLVLGVNHNMGGNKLLVINKCFSSFWKKLLNILLT